MHSSLWLFPVRASKKFALGLFGSLGEGVMLKHIKPLFEHDWAMTTKAFENWIKKESALEVTEEFYK